MSLEFSKAVPDQSAYFPWIILCSHCIVVKWDKNRQPRETFLTPTASCGLVTL